MDPRRYHAIPARRGKHLAREFSATRRVPLTPPVFGCGGVRVLESTLDHGHCVCQLLLPAAAGQIVLLLARVHQGSDDEI